MKSIIIFIIIIVLFAGAIGAWILLGPGTGFNEPKKALYIKTTAITQKAVLDSLNKNDIIKSETAFTWVANRLKLWRSLKPGKYEFKKGTSLLTIIRTLRNGQQTPVKLVINKVRTKEDFAHMVSSKFETDSLKMISFLNSEDSLKNFSADTSNALWNVLPDTYTFFWNTTPKKIYQRLYDASKGFWDAERKEKAAHLGLSPLQAYTLASIVEEETNANAEKGNIASVYMNRMQKGMPLQADPTIKFAMRDFGLKRIYEKYLFTQSPYNTYRNKGLPPGPICTPTKTTIDAVLNAPKTDYIYFVANSSFNGTHVFSSNYTEHMQKAKQYQQALNQYQAERKEKTAVK